VDLLVRTHTKKPFPTTKRTTILLARADYSFTQNDDVKHIHRSL
jgi:hypothetical protein